MCSVFMRVPVVVRIGHDEWTGQAVLVTPFLRCDVPEITQYTHTSRKGSLYSIRVQYEVKPLRLQRHKMA